MNTLGPNPYAHSPEESKPPEQPEVGIEKPTENLLNRVQQAAESARKELGKTYTGRLAREWGTALIGDGGKAVMSGAAAYGLSRLPGLANRINPRLGGIARAITIPMVLYSSAGVALNTYKGFMRATNAPARAVIPI